MEYVYAALLLHKLKQDVTENNVKNVIKSTGTSPDEVKVKALVAALSDVNIDDALKSAPVALPTHAVDSSAPVTQASGATKEEAKDKDKEKEEKKEEEALEGLSSLFG
jgi:large subunit ribosomal protein L12